MRKYKKLKEKVNKQFENIISKSDEVSKNMEEFIEINNKMLDNFEKLDKIVEDIDKEFAEKTGILNKKDQMFLWTAVALQTLRWWLLKYDIDSLKRLKPDTLIRETADKGGNREIQERNAFLKEREDKTAKANKFISWKEYFIRAVPYDAMKGEGAKNIEILGVKKVGKNLYGKNHHSATLGHDPILGYFFGTINIMTSTITFNKPLFPTYKVNYPIINEAVSFIETFHMAIEAGIDDKYRIPAAIIRQTMHLASDINTKMGLPIPLLNAEMQQRLLEKGWNSKELEKITKVLGKNLAVFSLQVIIGIFINIIIKTLHLMMYDEAKDGNYDLYNVRTQKILKISNIIAESLNIVYVGSSIVIGKQTGNPELIKEGMKRIDLGGYIVAVHQIVKSSLVQEKIRREYLENKLYDKFLGENYSFLEEE